MPMREAIVRPAQASDIAGVRALLVKTWHDTYDPLIGAEKVTEITDSWHSLGNLTRQLSAPDCTFLVADEGGAVVGHAFASAQRPPVLFLTRLYVLPARQRDGIGKRLLDTAIARHPSSEVVRLEAMAGNTTALAFYRREGFRVTAEKMIEGIEHFEMEKPLKPSG